MLFPRFFSYTSGMLSSSSGTEVSLNRNTAFWHLWIGMSISQIGFQIGQLALSVLAINELHASEQQLGWLGAMNTVAFLVIGLPAGVWIDHLRKRPIMIAADLIRALALFSIPIAALFHVLSFAQLLVVTAVIGFATVFFDVSYQSYLPRIVRPHNIAPANGRMEASYQLARVAGPGIAGWLLHLVGAATAYLLTAGSYLASAISIALIHKPEPQPVPSGRKMLSELKEGLLFVRKQQLLFPLFSCIALAGLTSQGYVVLLPLLALRGFGMSSLTLGSILSLAAIGGVIGVLLRNRVQKTFGIGPTIISCYLLNILAMFLAPAAVLVPAHAIAMLLAANFISAIFMSIYNVTQMSLRQQLCPPELLGRMNAIFRFAVWGVMPLGAVFSGWLASLLGVVPALTTCIALSLLPGLLMLLTPVAKLKQLAPVN